MADFETVPAAEVPAEAAVLDVRETYEFLPGHAPGAVHIPVDDIPAQFEQALDPDEDYYVICRTGGRSVQIAAWLTAKGYSVFFVAGGYDAWISAGHPLESTTGEEPRIL
ncbi:rhodanese-like domain-containing protein [Nesterenkonia sphaerica]|uniref:Rhodanese-like domain-containing protein n=1 Tax=Nesterenkonia sphaerica TaxID=1804988 RepID=A0A5R9A4H8_9MICC|nr:rhodanese-like domain-containing protein [Nesterenkonia sphaerica]TLP72817.1 rhodanese-like domain-containing protein [Nesterenkonia sphaerica]